MTGKKSMKNQVEKDELEMVPGQQMDLIEVGPENTKEIKKHALLYKKAQKERIAALEIENDEKEKILELIRKAGLKPLEDGKIKFRCDGFIITVTPRDELVKIKEENDDE